MSLGVVGTIGVQMPISVRPAFGIPLAEREGYVHKLTFSIIVTQ